MKKGFVAISTYVAAIILVVLAVGIGVSLFLYFSGYLTGMTGATEQQQQQIFECIGARLDIDYYNSDGKLTVRIVNTGSVNLGRTFSIRIEVEGEQPRYEKLELTKDLSPGEYNETSITNLSGKTITKVTVTPLERCQIPYTRIKEVVLSTMK